MSEQSALSREQLLRILMLAVIAAAALLFAVGGMVAYSAHVVDGLQRAGEVRLVNRRIERKLVQMRDDVLSASVWTDAYVALRANDLDWMQGNLGEYYADYMGHEVTVAYDAGGGPVYASRDSQPVAVASEAAFARAIAPLVEDVRRTGAKTSGVAGLEAVTARGAVVMVGAEPYFVTASTVVHEEVDLAPGQISPVVVSGLRVASFVPTLAADLGLDAPRMVVGERLAMEDPAVMLHDTGGHAVGVLTWIPARPGAQQLLGAIPFLTLLLGVMIAALVFVGLRVYRLITDLALNEAALDRSLAVAETANAAKSQFLANMSHELRTPLNGIIAMTELLRARQTDENSRQMADTIVSSGRTLESVVNDILDVSKIEAGQMKFDIQPFDFARILREAAELHAAAAAAKGVRLELVMRDDALGLYEGDRNRISQVVSNLLSNAVKFTERGGIRISARSGPQGLRIAVSDTGVGFDRATAVRLFQRFEQADVSVSRKYGGTGLGLSICSALVTMMGGRIAVRSIVGGGSTFITWLPLKRLGDAPAQAPAPGPVAAATPVAVRILFADDHEVNRKVVSMILEPLGVDLVQVENGAMAVEAAGASAFDLILMDVQMPVMDGLTATREIRALETRRGTPRTPVISLTANAMPDDIARSLEAGSDLHLAKPIRPDALIQAIQTLLARSDADPAEAAAA